MSKSEESTIEVKLFVDKEKRKVLFAESDKELVDVLFSFLTMPLGTIVRLLGKQSQIGCLDQIYKSVEDLSSDYFQTKACKAMLLAPLNAASSHCSRLKINIDGTKPRAVYVCKDTNCFANGDCAFSSVPDAVCKCGKVMQYAGERPENDGETTDSDPEKGVFVKGPLKFITTDDLHVAPASTSLMLSLSEKYGVQDPADLEQRIVQLGSEKITSLLKRSLIPKQPLTGLYFDVPIPTDDTSLCTLPVNLRAEQVTAGDDKIGSVKIRVLQSKSNSVLLYAEVGHDFVDIIFGLLSVPLGALIKTFSQWSPKGCIGNLYGSIVENAEGTMRPGCQSLLLAPKLAPFCGCGATKILEIHELTSRRLNIDACFRCLKIGGFSNLQRCYEKNYKGAPICTNATSTITELNPKSLYRASEKGEGYVKLGHMKFVVTDGLHVLPLSLSTTLQEVGDAKIQMEELVEKEITLTKCQVMEIQRATLMSRNALSSVLLPPKTKGRKLAHRRSGLYY